MNCYPAKIQIIGFFNKESVNIVVNLSAKNQKLFSYQQMLDEVKNQTDLSEHVSIYDHILNIFNGLTCLVFFNTPDY